MISIASPLHALSADPDYPRLKEYVIAHTGLSYYQDKDAQLGDHVAKRISQLGLPDCAAYLQLIRSDEIDGPELDRLIAMLTIGETFFFRHQEAFNALREVVFPELIRRNQSLRKLRIWSAGCSIGAEPYSIAIQLKRDLGHLLDGWEITIVATDINRDCLDRARTGRYEEWAFRSVPEDIKHGCFQRSGNAWVINPTYQENVSFQYHNLVRDPCPALRNRLDGFDLIICRNVTIYFNQETIRNLVQELYFSLVDRGWLLVGHSEPSVETYRSFRTVNAPGVVLYQKSTEEPAALGWVPPTVVSPIFPPLVIPQPPKPSPSIAMARPKSFPRHEQNGQSLPPSSSPAVADLMAIRQIADQGDIEAAAKSCEGLLQREKLNPQVHFYYALILEQMGHRREMQESLRRAIYLDRNFVIAHYYLGLVQQRLTKQKEASRSFRNALELLSALKPDDLIPGADEFTAGELKKLTEMHLKALEKL